MTSISTPALRGAVAALLLSSPAAAAQWIEPAHVLRTLDGDTAAAQYGYALAAVGDCDGDGVSDFAVGAAFHSAGGPSAGRVQVVSGATGVPLFHRDGRRGDQLGLSVAGGGDVNGDGHDDVLVGAPQRFDGAGRVLVLSGRDGDVLVSLGGEANRDRFGAAVEFIGDFDADGVDDFAVGAPGFNPPATAAPEGESAQPLRDGGRVTIFSGRTAKPLLVQDGGRYRGRFGAALHGRFEAGTELLAVGEPGAGRSADGRVHVYRGRDLVPAFRIEGDEATRGLGASFVSIVGDVNGDGVGDVYASDWTSKARGDRTGIALVHCGVTGSRLLTLHGENAYDGFGSGDGRVGDVDGDGCDDLLVGAWLSRDAADKGGKVVLFSGRTGKELRRWTGDEAGASLGFDATGLGDVDGDGQLDFLFSAALSDRETASGPAEDAGVVFLVSGEVCEPGEHLAPEPIDLPTMEEAIAFYRRREFGQAAHAFGRIAEARPEEMRAWVLLGLSLHTEGRYEEALAAHLRAARFPQAAVRATYNAACAHALLGNRDQAFDLLRRAIEHGFDDLRHIEADRDLVSLRDDPRWNEILPAAEGLGTFLEPSAVVLHELVGDAPGAHFGWALAVPGDCDGDGVDDLFVSAPYHAAEGVEGRVDLISGRTGAHLYYRLGPPRSGFGKALAVLGDSDGDGVSELAVGAPGARGGVGRVHVLSGVDGQELFVVEGPGAGDQFGRDLAGIGDFDGDGIGDLAVGASGDGTGLADQGLVLLLSGFDGGVLARLVGASPDERFGSAVAGRFDGEERVLAVGAQDGGPMKRGRVYVYRGDLSEPAFTVDGDDHSVDLGRIHVSLLPDRDGDGLSELVLGEWRHGLQNPRTGQLRLVSGADGAEHLQLHGRRPGEGFGIGAVTAGDLDGDGEPDLLAGAWLSDEGAAAGGKVVAVSGATGRDLATWTSTFAHARFGSSVTGIGDVNGDGVPDVAVGAPSRSRVPDRPGRVFVLSGAAARVRTMRQPDAAFGPGDDQDR